MPQVVDELRHQVAELHRELVRYQLVVWTAGNVSARVPGEDLLVTNGGSLSVGGLVGNLGNVSLTGSGKSLLVGELTTGGGNLVLNAKFYADFSHCRFE